MPSPTFINKLISIHAYMFPWTTPACRKTLFTMYE